MHRVQAGAGTPTIASRLRKMFAAAGRLCVNIFDAIAEARAQKAMIEAELYLNRYKHTSKNDDDLPVVRWSVESEASAGSCLAASFHH
jgi:hypothetical protein